MKKSHTSWYKDDEELFFLTKMLKEIIENESIEEIEIVPIVEDLMYRFLCTYFSKPFRSGKTMGRKSAADELLLWADKHSKQLPDSIWKDLNKFIDHLKKNTI
jgi:hypothetical protein